MLMILIAYPLTTSSHSLQSSFMHHSLSHSLSTSRITFLSKVSSWCPLWGTSLPPWFGRRSPATPTSSTCIVTLSLPPSPLHYTCLLIPRGTLGDSAFLLPVLSATHPIAGPMRSKKGLHIVLYAGMEAVPPNAAFQSQMALNCWSPMRREVAGWRRNISFDSVMIFCCTMYNFTFYFFEKSMVWPIYLLQDLCGINNSSNLFYRVCKNNFHWTY